MLFPQKYTHLNIVLCTMMPITIQIFGDFLCLESDFERLAFCIKTICTSKSPKWTGDSYKPKKYFGYNGKLIRKSIFQKKILSFCKSLNSKNNKVLPQQNILVYFIMIALSILLGITKCLLYIWMGIKYLMNMKLSFGLVSIIFSFGNKKHCGNSKFGI